MAPDLLSDFVERAAVLEYDGGLSRAEAERQASGEILDARFAEPVDGILGELAAAASLRCRPEIDIALADLRGCRAMAWGPGWIAPAGRGYRPAEQGEPWHPAIIVPAVDDGGVVDLVAQDLATGRLLSRLDVAAIIGADEVEAARDTGRAAAGLSRPVVLAARRLSGCRRYRLAAGGPRD